MFKILYEEGVLNIEQILLREYRKMNLTSQEVMVLIFLFERYETKIFSSLFLAQKVNLSKNEVENILEELIQKKFFVLSQDERDNKIIEVFDLNNTFKKLEQIYSEKAKNNQIKKQNKYITQTIEQIEKLKGENLASYELEIIKNWFLDKNYSFEEINKSINIAVLNQKKSIYYIDRILNHKNILKIENDEKADQILHKIFNKIK
ncbi:DnaD domain protein [Columbia Basin potato purple top phytoplasma]|uniref:Chromosome replication initiation protein n=1 Tax=Columbia Basin potato purple top phytoplasma TaxID=307134 RepID=A0ABT5L8F1_9MOLU|nr:DnaD domain protein [Columbia Basin potato purple top phytoplasma]MDC9031933.1 chromosome replication initiation protein [Columbia Basin potato purple top phytoplasma]